MSQSDPSSEPIDGRPPDTEFVIHEQTEGPKRLERRLADLKASNGRREQAMSAQGAGFDPTMTLRLQITSMHKVLSELTAVFDEAEPEIAKAKLLAGTAPSPTLLTPNGHRPS